MSQTTLMPVLTLLWAFQTSLAFADQNACSEAYILFEREGVPRADTLFGVSLAETAIEQRLGLMNVTDLPEDRGMLFIYDAPAEVGFWMKNTLIPLDMIFISQDRRIHRIHQNAIPLDLTTIPSLGPVTMVLEVNGGIADAVGLEPGDRMVAIPRPSYCENQISDIR